MDSSHTINIAVILAGGKGSRFGGDLPKQFIKIDGKTIIERTIEAFDDCEVIDEIAIVINPDFVSEMEHIVNQNQYRKVKKILPGGKERSDSSLAAINAYKENTGSTEPNLIFHDAVRPFVNSELIQKVVQSLQKYNAVNVAVPVTDTIIEINEDNTIKKVPPRHLLQKVQTPQAFKLNVIQKAYENALEDPNFLATDDCGVVLKYLPQEPIGIVEGYEANIKVTYELDMLLAEQLVHIK